LVNGEKSSAERRVYAPLVEIVCNGDDVAGDAFIGEGERMFVALNGDAAVGEFLDVEGGRGEQVFALEVMSILARMHEVIPTEPRSAKAIRQWFDFSDIHPKVVVAVVRVGLP
jgi:hypothetical protein